MNKRELKMIRWNIERQIALKKETTSEEGRILHEGVIQGLKFALNAEDRYYEGQGKWNGKDQYSISERQNLRDEKQ